VLLHAENFIYSPVYAGEEFMGSKQPDTDLGLEFISVPVEYDAVLISVVVWAVEHALSL